MANFLWGSAGQKMSPAQVAEQRKIAQALIAEGSDTSPVGHWTAALNRGLQGYLGGRQAYQAREAEAAGRAGYEAKKAGMANASTFGGADPVAAALSGGQGAAGWSGGSLNPDGDLASGIAETAEALGMDPVDLATIISYETAGTFDPTKAGPTTQWGQHRGLIQFGEPQAAEYGVDWNNPVGSQLGANGAIVNYFTKNGWQPGMGLLDAYSIVNAGAPGRYNASDANNGGAPGTVADKVNNQMAGHRQKAMSLFGGGSAAPANSTENIAALLSDEWAPESERAVLQAQYDAALKQQDPMYQAQYEGQVLANQKAARPVVSDYDQRAAAADQFGLQGDARQAFILTGNIPGMGGAGTPAEIQVLEWRAKEAGLTPGTEEYKAFVRNGGKQEIGRPAAVEAIHQRALMAGLVEGTPAYQEFMRTNGAGDVAAAQVTGKAAAEQAIAAPAEINAADDTLGYIQEIRDHPGREWGTGMSAWTGWIPGTPAYDFAQRVGQLEGGAFLTAIGEMQGMGALSNQEGQTAKAAIARLNTATTEEGFMAALDDYERIIRRGRERAQKRIRVDESANPEARTRRIYNPETGAFE